MTLQNKFNLLQTILEKKNQLVDYLETFAGIPKGLINTITYAIKYKKYMTINYNNKYSSAAGDRVIIPTAFGTHKPTGRLILRAYLVRGTSYSLAHGISDSRWKLYLLSQINFYEVSTQSFYLPPAGYKINDKSINVREQLEFSAIKEENIDWWT